MGSYRDVAAGIVRADKLRRRADGPRHDVGEGKNFDLAPDHRAVLEYRTRYPRSRALDELPLKSGHNNTKIGKKVLKGKWAGFPIFTLSLEERATCPQSCPQLLNCFGNKMPFAKRYQAGPELERFLCDQLAWLSVDHPGGFLVRLHVLGDFYAPSYVDKWRHWMELFPALHVFGYTAWSPDDEIGAPLYRLMMEEPRFRIRFSNREWAMDSTVMVKRVVDAPPESIVCPAQTSATDCCGTCGLCWNSRKQIAFLEH